MAKILVVDDELGIRDLLLEILHDEGHTVELAENANQARSLLTIFGPDLVLLDIWMPDTDGISLLKEWTANKLLTMPVIMMSGHSTIETAIEATRLGAKSFLEKPITLQKLLTAVEQGLVTPETANKPEDAGPSALEVVMMAGCRAIEIEKIDFPLVADQVFNLEGTLREVRDTFEKTYFEYHLAQENGSMTKVAEKTGLERTHLYRKLKQLGIEIGRSKRGGR